MMIPPPLPRAGVGARILFALLALLPVALSAASALPPAVPLASAAPDQASIYPFVPAANKNTGAAVLIVPGVPFDGRSTDHEGVQLARWLNDRGIAGFVLRQSAPHAGQATAAATVSVAVRHLRTHAADFKISARRVGVLGFGRGAEFASDAAYAAPVEEKPGAAEKISDRPDLLALIWGASQPATIAAGSPPTFLVSSTHADDKMDASIELWTKLRASRVPVDAHFFAKADAATALAANNPSVGSWPEIFYNWIRFQGLLTDAPRVPLKGMVYLDGRTLPHGYVVLTPVDFVGVGPVVARVLNSTLNLPLGEFSVPVGQGPIAGRYKVDVRQNMNRWLSNGFTGGLTGGRGGNVTPEQAYFGHHRALAPTIEDQRSFTKVRPTDRTDYVIEIKPDPTANLDLKIEVFSK